MHVYNNRASTLNEHFNHGVKPVAKLFLELQLLHFVKQMGAPNTRNGSIMNYSGAVNFNYVLAPIDPNHSTKEKSVPFFLV